MRLNCSRSSNWTEANLETVKTVISNRVNIQGVSEPLIYTKPESNQIIVELPGLKDEAEIKAIGKTLERTRWNRKEAARLLNISYKALLYKIRQYGLEKL